MTSTLADPTRAVNRHDARRRSYAIPPYHRPVSIPDAPAERDEDPSDAAAMWGETSTCRGAMWLCPHAESMEPPCTPAITSDVTKAFFLATSASFRAVTRR